MHSISINAIYTPRLKQVFTIDILRKLVHLCDTLAHRSLYKAIFLVAFFGYLRLSSLVPSSRFHKFQLQRSHFAVHPLGMSLTLPCTKTHQHYDQIHSVVLPRINNSVLCPLTAITEMFVRIPALHSDTVFGYWDLGSYVPLVVHRVRQMLARCVRQLRLDPGQFTFHAFHRSGATYSFNQNVPLRILDYMVVGKAMPSMQTTSTADKVAQHF